VKASAIGIFQRTNEGCFIDFTKRDESDLGVRNAHLSNKVIKLADFISSEDLAKGKTPKTYWSTIYPEIEFKQLNKQYESKQTNKQRKDLICRHRINHSTNF
jgi:hypothetical protein